MQNQEFTSIFIILVAVIAIFASKWKFISGSYRAGAALWSRLLPVLSVTLFFSIILANLAFQHRNIFKVFALGGFFSNLELILLMLCGVFYITRIGQWLALSCTIWMMFRSHSLILPSSDSSTGLSLLISSSTIIAILGDQMPWYPKATNRLQTGNYLRSLMIASVSISVIGMIVFSLTRLKTFQTWLPLLLQTSAPTPVIAMILYTTLIGWTLVLLGSNIHAMLLILSLPTVIIVSFVTRCQIQDLTSLMVFMLALALASAERRITQKLIEHNGRITMVLLGNHLY